MNETKVQHNFPREIALWCTFTFGILILTKSLEKGANIDMSRIIATKIVRQTLLTLPPSWSMTDLARVFLKDRSKVRILALE